MSTMDAGKLVLMAERILAAKDLSVDELLDCIQKYSDEFSKWLPASGEGRKKSLSGEDRKALEHLQNCHNRVIQMAAELKEKTAETLNKLKKRGKGIRAYSKTPATGRSTLRSKKW